MIFIFSVLVLFVMRYLWVRLRHVVPLKKRWLGGTLFVLALISSFLYRALPDHWVLMGTLLVAIGSFFMVYLGNWLVVCLSLDFALGVGRLLGRLSLQTNRAFRARWLPRLSIATLLLTSVFFAYGVPNQLNFLVRPVEVKLKVNPVRPLRIAVITDVHFDLMFPKAKLAGLVDSLKQVKPDAIIFAGDLADISASLLGERGLDSLFREIQAPYGFWGVTGNHEAYLNPEGGTIEWAKANGLTFLHDSTACTELFCISGRLDHHYAQANDATRADLSQLLIGVQPDKPWVVVDHQPKGLVAADLLAARMPDIVISGHTHAGQFFPWTLVIGLVWPLAEGLGVLNGVPWYVSSGFGQWGPPLRVGTSAEMVLLTLE